MTQPRLSIVTVVYNAVTQIEQTILSVAAQAGPGIEYLVIDGGSQDGTVEVLRRLAPEIQRWTSERDRGIYDAMNKGFEWSRGEWIYFLNAGDTLREGMLAKMLDLAAGSMPRPDLFCAKVAMVDPTGQTLNYTHPVTRGDTARLLRENCIAHQATLVHRSMFERHGGFSLDYRIMGDYEYWIRLLRAGATFHFDDLVVAEFSTGGVSSRRENYLAAQRERLGILVRHGYLSPARASFLRIRDAVAFRAKTFVRTLLGERLSDRITLARARRS
jgi:glycosyltransferase involved in cell wall biosynthesis